MSPVPIKRNSWSMRSLVEDPLLGSVIRDLASVTLRDPIQRVHECCKIGIGSCEFQHEICN